MSDNASSSSTQASSAEASSVSAEASSVSAEASSSSSSSESLPSSSSTKSTASRLLFRRKCAKDVFVGEFLANHKDLPKEQRFKHANDAWKDVPPAERQVFQQRALETSAIPVKKSEMFRARMSHISKALRQASEEFSPWTTLTLAYHPRRPPKVFVHGEYHSDIFHWIEPRLAALPLLASASSASSASAASSASSASSATPVDDAPPPKFTDMTSTELVKYFRQKAYSLYLKNGGKRIQLPWKEVAFRVGSNGEWRTVIPEKLKRDEVLEFLENMSTVEILLSK